MVVKAEPGTMERELCEQRVKLDKGGYQQGRDYKKQEQGKEDTQVTPGLKAAFVDKSQITSAGTP